MNKGIIFSVGTDMFSRTSGAHRIATELRTHNWDIEVVDFVLYWELEELKNFFITRYDSKVCWVGFSFLFNKFHRTIDQFVSWIKKHYPHVAIIFGSNSLPQYKNSDIDYHVYGYGENAIISLLLWLYSSGERPNIREFENRKVIYANNDYPSAPFKDPVIIYEDRDFIKDIEWLGIEFSRGCKFKCDFCNFPLLGVKGDYTRSTESFKIQLQNAYDRFGVTKYVATDETFNDSSEKIKKFADVVEQLPFKPYFTGFVRGDLLVSRKDDREHFLRMNFLGHYYGIETFNHVSGKSVGKGLHPERLKDGLVECKHFFKTHGNSAYRGDISIIIGLPHEPIESIYETQKWLVDHWSDESFTTFPLLILKPEHDLNKNSKFSLNYEKYGYTDISSNNMPDEFKRMSDYQVIWKNQHMDIFDAHRLSDEMDQIYKKVKIGAFNLGNMGLPADLHDRLAISNDEFKKYSPKYFEFINNYKTQKLNHR